MVVSLAHHKWRKRLLESRNESVYYIITDKNEQANEILFTYSDGIWEIGVDNHSLRTDEFSNVDLAADYIISLGVEEYDSHLSIVTWNPMSTY
ncbi:hypothetical protein J7E79_24130 [Bacillus sp. ISL-40]|uniref:hypothetical protein n=1 Tax=Bacillus sp. ISL-40 TaxID=2819126 RepID=UPI001BEAD4EE|nr:hypothetical protein [Bacillus sp. ISL-40]MBT2700429.1 hypothetical protein [Bacillus sp. ISL-40]